MRALLNVIVCAPVLLLTIALLLDTFLPWPAPVASDEGGKP